MVHGVRKVERMNVRAELGEEGRILAGPTSKLKNAGALHVGQYAPRDQLIEIAGQIAVRVIGWRPLIVRLANTHSSS